MKRIPIKPLALLLVTVLLCQLLPASFAQTLPTEVVQENLLPNGGFENGGTDGWNCTAKVEVIADAAKDGRYGVHATSKAGDWTEYDGLYGDFAVEPNTDYVFSFDHKSDITATVIVYIKDADKGTIIKQDWPTQVPGCWSRQEYHFHSGDCDRIRIQLCVGAKNAVRLFDNIRLHRPRNVIFGGGLGSVSDTQADQKGLAFRFDVNAAVQVAEYNTFVSGRVAPFADGKEYPLVRMGAVVTNQAIATEDLTLAAVNGKTCIDIPANRVYAASADKASFTARVANVPLWAQNITVTARPYCIFRDGDEEFVFYAPAAYSETCDGITARRDAAAFDAGKEWELIWNDEFGGTAVDQTKWYGELGVEEGNFYFTNREENVSVKDGSMVLTALAEPIANSRFTGCRVNTGNKFSFLYGRLEFRAKLPWGKGIAPALWTLGDYYLYNNVGNGWPYGGEIDIMELVGDSNTDPASVSNRTTTHNIHWGYDRDTHYEVGSGLLMNYVNEHQFQKEALPSEDYHVYAVEWDYRHFTFFVDDLPQKQIRWGTDPDGRDYLEWFDGWGHPLGKKYQLFVRDDAGRVRAEDVSCADLDFAFCNEENPHFLIMNTAICGWNANQATNGGNLPQSMYVDYVRVYQKIKDEIQ